MTHPHGVVEPVLANGAQCIRFVCPCGWQSQAERPNRPGALRLICTQYREHLAEVGYYPMVRTSPDSAGLLPE